VRPVTPDTVELAAQVGHPVTRDTVDQESPDTLGILGPEYLDTLDTAGRSEHLVILDTRADLDIPGTVDRESPATLDTLGPERLATPGIAELLVCQATLGTVELPVRQATLDTAERLLSPGTLDTRVVLVILATVDQEFLATLVLESPDTPDILVSACPDTPDIAELSVHQDTPGTADRVFPDTQAILDTPDTVDQESPDTPGTLDTAECREFLDTLVIVDQAFQDTLATLVILDCLLPEFLVTLATVDREFLVTLATLGPERLDTPGTVGLPVHQATPGTAEFPAHQATPGTAEFPAHQATPGTAERRLSLDILDIRDSLDIQAGLDTLVLESLATPGTVELPARLATVVILVSVLQATLVTVGFQATLASPEQSPRSPPPTTRQRLLRPYRCQTTRST